MALDDLLKPQLCELGKIKIGAKGEERTTRTGGKFRMPKKLDHFIITTMQRDSKGDLIPDSELMETLAKQFGSPDGHLRELPVTLLSNDIEDVIQARWVWYAGKKLGAYCDDLKTLHKFVDVKTGKPLDKPVAVPWEEKFTELQHKGGPMFKLHTTLSCVIAASDARWGGVYRFRTTSRISGDQLYGSLIHIRQLTNGVLRGIPMRLVVRPVQVSPAGKATTVYVVHLELRGPDLGEIQRLALERARTELTLAEEIQDNTRQYKAMLKAWEDPDDEEVSDIVEEFLPEQAAQDEGLPSEDPLLKRPCSRHGLCELNDGHEGDCMLPAEAEDAASTQRGAS